MGGCCGFTTDSATICTYGPFSANDVILLVAYASPTENQDVIDTSVVTALGDPSRAHAGIKLLGFKPFNPAGKHLHITYLEVSSGKLWEGTYPLISLTQQHSPCRLSR
jgi:H+-transporting ATPase